MEPDAADSFRHFFRQATGQEQGPYPDQEKLATLDFPVRKRMNRRGIDERCLASAESAISNSRSPMSAHPRDRRSPTAPASPEW
jgi:hypothetical protein